jgi:hypothetical protein
MTSGYNEPPEGGQPSFEKQPPPEQQYGSPPPPPEQQQYGRPAQAPTYGPPPNQPVQQPQYGAPPQQPYGAPQQQAYGQPPYGQYGGGYQPAPYGAPRSTPSHGQAFGTVGAVVALIAAAAGAVAVTALKWFSTLGRAHFSDVHDLVKGLGPVANGFGKAYFSWLGYLLLAAAVVFALLANAPTPARVPLRIFGFLVGLGGMGVTFLGIKFSNNATYKDFLKHADVGFYVMLGAFALAAIASIIPAPSSTRI